MFSPISQRGLLHANSQWCLPTAQGIPPDHDRVQTFLLHVEGIFQQVPSNVARTTDGLLSEFARVWQDHGCDQARFLQRCVNACLDCAGEPLPRRGGNRGGKGGEGEEPEGPEVVGSPCYITTAKTVMNLKKQLSRELTEEKLLHYMCEWCHEPKMIEASCCYESPAPQVERSTLANCFLRIPHCLKGSIPMDVLAQVQKFYAQTFWGNIAMWASGASPGKKRTQCNCSATIYWPVQRGDWAVPLFFASAGHVCPQFLLF